MNIHFAVANHYGLGGTASTGFNDPTGHVDTAELWDPATEIWTPLASSTGIPRVYHSTALLLPDGRVFSTGGNHHPEVELYSPPYLFKGARPTIATAPPSGALAAGPSPPKPCVPFPVTVVIGVVMTEPVGALLALKLTHTPFSVSSVLGLLALLGVSVETAVILVSYINKLRLENHDIRTATREAALLRLRPIMMTALVACLGLLPAALSTGIGSDTQKPFAIVIVAGLISRLLLGFFVNPVLYEMVAKQGDVLQV